VQLLGRVRVVANVDGDGPSFAQPDQRTGKLPVVEGRGDDAIWREFHEARGDTDRIVRRCRFRRRVLLLLRTCGERRGNRADPAEPQKVSTIDGHVSMMNRHMSDCDPDCQDEPERGRRPRRAARDMRNRRTLFRHA
jgi:hypothetical protein